MSAKTLWPERESLYELLKLRATIGEAAFNSEKENNPVDPSLCEWPEHYFTGSDIMFDRRPSHLVVKTIALDPSKGPNDNKGGKSDYSAIVRYGCSAQGVEYVEADLAKRDVERMIADLVQHVIDFEPEEVAVETNSFQELLIVPLRAEYDRRQKEMGKTFVLTVAGMVNTVNKDVRIRRHGPYLCQRRVRFKSRSPGTALLLQQLRDFAHGDFDDGPDSWDMARRRAIELVNGRAERKVSRLRV